MSDLPEYDGTLGEVVEWAEAMGAARVERDRLILKAHKEGHSLRTIGDAAYLSHAAIKKIIDRA